MPTPGSTGTVQVMPNGTTKSVALSKPVSKEAAAKTASEASQFEILHERVGQWAQGELVEAKALKESGIDIARLVGLGAVRASAFTAE